ncbi:MAG: prenyltransferase, partial [Rhizobiales bacterium]|nr:prenyltransferase [Hyphomicrobiales bacterium]
MSANLSPVLTSEEISSLVRDITAAGEADDKDTALQNAQGLRKVQSHQPEAALALLHVIDNSCLPPEAAAAVFCEIAQAHPDDPGILPSLGECFEATCDLDDLNGPPPEEPEYQAVVERLTALAHDHSGTQDEAEILRGLATSARMMGRQCDDIAENSYRRQIELNPKKSSNHYNLGLFFKTRGRFDEGMKANQTAISLSDETVDGYEWNLGICATGAGHGEVALDVWKRMGQKIEMGRFGLPEGGYPQCKVKLAERPLAERGAENDHPGLEETIWIERLSPCHGVIR